MEVIKHLLRLEVLVRLFSLKQDAIDFLRNLQDLNTRLIKIYKIDKETGLDLSVRDASYQLVKTPNQMIGLLQKSREYIRENSQDLDFHLIKEIISRINEFIYSLKYERE